MEKIKNMTTTQFSNLETKTMMHLRNLEETTVKNLQTMNNELSVEMKKYLRELVDSFMEELRPLMKDMAEFGKFKESTIKHLVSLTKQIQDLQKEVDTAKQSISNSVQTSNQQIDTVRNEIAESLDKNINDLTNSNNNSNNNSDQTDSNISTNNNSNNINYSNSSNNSNNDNNFSHRQICEQLEFLCQKINCLEKKSDFWESKFCATQDVSSTSCISQSDPTPHELQLQERKKNNLIIFGLKENHQDGSWNDKDELQALLSELGSTVNLDETHFFCVGKNLERSRPMILKLSNQNEKGNILFMAKNLKNNRKWEGVAITHDLTKFQCQEEKAREVELKRMAEEKNQSLLEKDKARRWKVVGGRGNRRLMLWDT